MTLCVYKAFVCVNLKHIQSIFFEHILKIQCKGMYVHPHTKITNVKN